MRNVKKQQAVTLVIMLETLQHIDQSLFLAVNGWHSPYWDTFMYLFTNKLVWIPLYVSILYVLIRNLNWRMVIFTIIAFALLVTVADQLCSSVLRPVFERPRPSHNPEIADIVHLVNGKRGGQFGFPSCHAANTFALACFVMLLFRNKTLSWFFMLWALVTCYTRAYIGVHYPGDLLFGTVVGFFAGILVYGIYRGCLRFHSLTDLLHYPQDRSRVEHQRPWHSTNLIFIAGVLTVIVFFLVSIWMRVN